MTYKRWRMVLGGEDDRELSPTETAALMERSQEAVRSLQHRAILALRAQLGDHGFATEERLS